MKRPALPLAPLLPLVTILGAVTAGALVGIEIALLVVAGGALVGVIALLWGSVQALTGESPLTLEEALSLGAPSAEEEQKRAVLRALKDLEFERGVGKITEDDYAELSARYRADARRLILAVDEGHAKERAEVERQLALRLGEVAEKAAKTPAAGTGDDAAPSRPTPTPDAAGEAAPAAATAGTVGKESA